MMSDNSALKLILSLDKDAYISGETIVGKLVLKNDGTEAVLANRRMALNSPFAPESFREVTFTVTDLSGEKLSFGPKINIGFPREDDFIELAPGEVVEHLYELSWAYPLDEPGEYSVQAIYQNQSDPSGEVAAWKGQLESNVVTFVIKEK